MPMRFLGGPSRSEITNVLVRDSLWEDIFYHQTLFEYAGGFSWVNVGTGTGIINGPGFVSLDTGAVIGSSAEMHHTKAVSYFNGNRMLVWSKERRIRASIQFLTDTLQLAYLTTGDRGPPPLGAPDVYFGFKIVNNQIFGCVGNGVVETLTAALYTFVAGELVLLEARFKPSVEVRFYINGADVGTITTNLPTGTNNSETLARAYIVNSEAAAKSLQFEFWEFYQAR